MSDQHNSAGNGSLTTPYADPADPNASRMDLVREGARRDGVEIAHYQPRFPTPGTKAEKRVERTIASYLALTGISAMAFVVIYVAWPWHYEHGSTFEDLFSADGWNLGKLYTPLLGITMGLALLGIGMAVITWAKQLLPAEVSIQERHPGASTEDDRRLTSATIANMLEETGIQRRPLLKRALAFGMLPVGAMAVVPLGALIKDPHKDSALFKTGFAKGIRLVREDGTPVRPEDISAGGLETVFPGIPGGTSNKYADSPTLLIHLRENEAEKARNGSKTPDANYGAYYAYSKICTHAGCPASLYEQQTHRLLCPCHQSQFDVLNGCKPIFGPATRPLPQLPIDVDDEGYFISTSDYVEATGPAFWERP